MGLLQEFELEVEKQKKEKDLLDKRHRATISQLTTLINELKTDQKKALNDLRTEMQKQADDIKLSYFQQFASPKSEEPTPIAKSEMLQSESFKLSPSSCEEPPTTMPQPGIVPYQCEKPVRDTKKSARDAKIVKQHNSEICSEVLNTSLNKTHLSNSSSSRRIFMIPKLKGDRNKLDFRSLTSFYCEQKKGGKGKENQLPSKRLTSPERLDQIR
jgi:hypothetical protein